MQNKKPSNLTEKSGILKPDTTHLSSVKKIVKKRAKQPSVNDFVNGIKEGNISLLSRAITLVESTQKKHQKKANTILEACLPFTNNSVRIGITGVPGVGKSTFIEALGNRITNRGKKVAVLAIDPSSSINKGSILGDKTRMESLVNNKKAFIRPSPSGTSLGGVAQKTREIIILCEAAGFDTILIETVGVGQSEVVVNSMVDFFLLLKLAGAGDELQGIKRGIIEMADTIIINKADGDNLKNVNIAKLAFTRALDLYPKKESGWIPRVITASGLHQKGIDDTIFLIDEYFKITKQNNYFSKKREKQNLYWLNATIKNQLLDDFFKNTKVSNKLTAELEKIKNVTSTPFQSAYKLLKLYNDQN